MGVAVNEGASPPSVVSAAVNKGGSPPPVVGAAVSGGASPLSISLKNDM